MDLDKPDVKRSAQVVLTFLTSLLGNARRHVRRCRTAWTGCKIVLPALREKLGPLVLLSCFLAALLLQVYIPSSAQNSLDRTASTHIASTLSRAFLYGEHSPPLVESAGNRIRTPEKPYEPGRSRVDVCERTAQVRDAIVASANGIDGCAELTASHLANIASLDLSGQGIENLRTGDFAGLSALRMLNLGDNRLTGFPADLFNDLHSLQFLYLNDNNLNALPGVLFEGHTRLEILYLYGNSLDTLPPELFDDLTSLKRLNLTDNNLHSLPDGLFDSLVNLEILRLGWNKLTFIPDELFERLVSLKYLNVFGNPGIGGYEEGTQTVQVRTQPVVERTQPDEQKAAVKRSSIHPAPVTSVTFALAELDGIEIPVSPFAFTPVHAPSDTDTDTETVAGATPDQTDASLTALSISYGGAHVPFTRTFTSDITNYRAWVPSTVDIVTLVAEPSDSRATLLYVPPDVDANPDNGHQVILAEEGVTIISVTVTGADGKTLRTYMATVLRQGPMICWPLYGSAAAVTAAAVLAILRDGAEAANLMPQFGFATGTRTLAENMGDETTSTPVIIGIPFKATDIDDDILTYSIGGPDAGKFDIVSATGQITSKAGVNYDHETQSSHSVAVTVDDGKGGSDTIGVTIRITDLNEPPLAPGQPVVAAVPGSRTSLAVSWAAPHNTGRPDIQSYNLQYREGSSGSWLNGPQHITDTAATISRLDEDKAYQVQVMASNAEGAGPWSSPGNGRTNRNNPPEFAGESAMRGLAESVGDAVTVSTANLGASLMATDVDGDTLTYSLGGTNAPLFTIDSSTGQLMTRAGVNYDHEATPNHSVTVTADDGHGGSDAISVTVSVNDVDEPPLAPEQPLVSAVTGSRSSLKVHWTEPPNTGRPGIQNYDLQYRESTGGTWQAGPQDVIGTDVVISNLEYGTSYQVQVLASNDEGDGPWSTPGAGQTNMNNSPEFTASTASRGLMENVGSAATTSAENLGMAFAATDTDGDTLTYSLGGTNAPLFAIDAGSGLLATLVGVNYSHEATPILSVSVKVIDGKGGSDTIPVSITVNDVNEPPLAPGQPVVTAVSGSKTSLSVSWSAPDNTGRPEIQSYSLQNREGDSGEWSNGPQHVTGTAAIISGLSENTTYQVQVMATNDEGDGPWSAPGSGKTDRNRPPQFADQSASRSFKENMGDATTTSGENLGAAITATDEDGDRLQYSLEGGNASLFTIDTGSGQLKTRVGVNYSHEATPTLSVIVLANDGRGGSDSIPVTIIVKDVDEPPLAPSPPSVTPMHDSMTALSVTWSPPYNMGRPDIESYDLRYRNGVDTDWNDGPQDQDVTKTVLYSLVADSEYAVQVRATNDEGDGEWSEIEIARTNTPVRSNIAPEFAAATALRSLTENTGGATRTSAENLGVPLTATDEDSTDTLSYSIEGTHASSFTVDTDSGQLKTKVGINYSHEATPTLSVTVRVRDGKGGSDTIAVTVTVNDVDEPPLAPAAPTVSAVAGSTTNLSVSWNSPSNTGRPSIDNYDLQFRPGTSGNWLDGPQNVGGTSSIFANLEPDSLYQVRVRASNDEGDGPYSLPGSGRTNAESDSDPSNNAPEFSTTTATRGLDENVGAATTSSSENLGDPFTATDEDSTDTLSYGLEGTNASSFDVDSGSGQLKTKVGINYDHEATPTLSVTIRVNDSNGGSDTIVVTVDVNDVEEKPLAPAAPTVSPVSGSISSLSVTWSAPSNTGRPDIDSYDLQYRPGTSGNWIDGPQDITGTSSSIVSLESDSLYQVQVRAENDDGEGPYSLPGSARTNKNHPPEFDTPTATPQPYRE